MAGFYERFDQKCKDNQTTMTAVLKKLSIPTSNMGNWKNGGCPREDKLRLIADELKCTMSFLRWGDRDGAQEIKKAPAEAGEDSSAILADDPELRDAMEPLSLEDKKKVLARAREYAQLLGLKKGEDY